MLKHPLVEHTQMKLSYGRSGTFSKDQTVRYKTSTIIKIEKNGGHQDFHISRVISGTDAYNEVVPAIPLDSKDFSSGNLGTSHVEIHFKSPSRTYPSFEKASQRNPLTTNIDFHSLDTQAFANFIKNDGSLKTYWAKGKMEREDEEKQKEIDDERRHR